MEQYQNLYQPQLCRRYVMALLDENLAEARRIQEYCQANRINIWYETIELLEYHREKVSHPVRSDPIAEKRSNKMNEEEDEEDEEDE